MALGPEHPGRVRGVGAGISTRQYFNLLGQQRVKFADQLKESVRLVLQEETLKIEARIKQLVEAERENLLNQLSQLIPNFDPSMLKLKTNPCLIQGQEQSPKNPMLDKASCSGALDGRALHFEDDIAKNGEKHNEMFAGIEEIGATVVVVYMSRHWVLIIMRVKKETVYFLDPLPGNRVVDEEGKSIVNSAIKMYNSHIGRQGRKAPIWKTLPGTPKQPSSVECGYYVMRFMRDIIMDPTLEFEKMVRRKFSDLPYPQEVIDEVRKEWAEFVCLHME
ncbi:hypothetical protein ACE6H2_006224 [Prunus campanulata]